MDLSHAIRAADLTAAAELLRGGADPNAKDPLGYPPLGLAAARGQVQMVAMLLTAGADPLLPETVMGLAPLHKAAQSGVVEVARLLLDHGAFVNQPSAFNGKTPLMEAVWYKRLPMVEFLLGRGANPDLTAFPGYGPSDLERVVGDDDFTPFRKALERARQARAQRDQEGLRTAALAGDAAGVRAALAGGADINRMSVDGHTPLLDAAREGHAEVVRVLLEAGADPRIVDDGDMKSTPAHKAGYMGHTEVARLLVADPRLELDAQGYGNGFTALHDAVWHGHTETARVFVEAGARLDLRSLDGRIPLDLARDYGYPDLVRLLTEAEQARAERTEG